MYTRQSSMSRKICEWDEFTPPRKHGEKNCKRCRKKATQAVLYRRDFGKSIGPHGETPVYLEKMFLACDCHADERTLNAAGVDWLKTAPLPADHSLSA